jgi:hypothetical protein
MSTLAPATVLALKRYEEIKIQMKELETEAKALQPDIIPAMPEGPVKTEYGTFTVRSKDSYVYSPETQAREKALKETKDREVQEGIATLKPGEPYLQYNPKKAGSEDY